MNKKYTLLNLETVIQLRFEGLNEYEDHEKLSKCFSVIPDVEQVKKVMTFETPIHTYRYKEIEFSVMFDEQENEVFVTIIKPQNHEMLIELIDKHINFK